MSTLSGTPVPRVEDHALLTRGGTYTYDLSDDRLKGGLHAWFVRSGVAHAQLRAVHTEAAASAPGVHRVFTGSDLDDIGTRLLRSPDFNAAMTGPLLATDRIRYVGEPVALVLAESRCAAEDAAGLVVVDCEPLTAVTDVCRAASDETLLFDDAGTNTVVVIGDPDAADPHLFDNCPVVIEQVITNQRLAPVPLETRAAAAVWGEDGRLTIWFPHQGAQPARQALAELLAIPVERIRVITPDVGGAFGAKYGAEPEHALVAWAARQVGRPVRWFEARSENLVAMVHGRAQQQRVTLGGLRDGTVRAYRLELLQDAGAYPYTGALLPSFAVAMASGTYAFERVDAWARSVVTNTTPVGAYRGAGRPEATAAIERGLDVLAAELEMDPAEVRRRNLIPAFVEPREVATGAVYDSGDYGTALDKVLAAADYDRLRAEQRQRRQAGDVRALGIGMACYVELTGGAGEAYARSERASVEMHGDGSVTVLTGVSPHGQGHETSWAMLTADVLGVPMAAVTVRWGDTDLVPEGGGTGGSRSLQLGGSAVRAACEQLLRDAEERAAALVDRGAVRFDRDLCAFVRADSPGAGIELIRLAKDSPLRAEAMFTAAAPTFPFGAHLAVVEVDTETGQIDLRRMVAVDEAGTVLNPLIVEGQLHGGIAQGIGQALVEEITYDVAGLPHQRNLATYPTLRAADLPDFELVSMQTPSPLNPLGVKGVAEAGTVGATPAVHNAVVDALAHFGVWHLDMPASPQRIWRALAQARQAR